MFRSSPEQLEFDEIPTEKEFGLSRLGFLPESCVQRLPKNCPFSALENIADHLPELNRSFTLEEAISRIDITPKNAPTDLNEGEKRRLYVILAMVIHSLVHGSKARWDLLDCDSLAKILPSSGNILAISRNFTYLNHIQKYYTSIGLLI